MTNKILYTIAVFLLLSFNLKAQLVKFITVSQLESRIKQGKDTTYVINFWATWCKPCVNELPEFERFKISVKGKPVKVILISADLKSKLESGVQPFVKAHRLTGEVYLLNEAPNSYNEKISADWSGALPGTLIVKNGKKKFHEAAFSYDELVAAVKQID
ncbi:TlpA family protein disulfide reductase [Mucilaginibacter sp. RB4R14]|uniref:TlpA family protein disulfide reductase n=1 Tax=Mucilaginibacter aurantiaciroseus TaxID=2949308 RepID=UPI002091DE6A|nr:TlpA family protein disulfide reductase [Mucilaginibacter aurantiaciroseus]MCO5936661.1 TlpA family protein disulfide reductase [Mucilaginibacter aurantiaciroseus]